MKNVGKRIKKQGPLTTIVFLTCLIGIISLILDLINVGGSVTEAGSLETTLVTVKNIFSKDGIKYILNNYVVNFQLLQPLIYFVMSLMSVSILEASGLINYLAKPLKKTKKSWITFLVLFTSIIATFIGEFSFILLIPFVCALYKVLERNPLLGMITVFLGVTIGTGAGIFFNYQDYLMSLTTLTAASNIDKDYIYPSFGNLYIMIFSTITLSIVGTISIEKLLVKKFKRYDYENEVNLSKKAFRVTSFIALILIAFVIYAIIPSLPMSGMLLNASENAYIAKLFGDNSAFGNGLMLIITGIIVFCGFIYGIISGNIRHKNDYTHCLTASFENTGYVLVIMFFASIMLGLLDWSNIPTVIATNIVDLVGSLSFNGSLLVFIVFVSITIITIIMPTTITKWNIIAPVYVPLLMRANISPAFTQSIFMVADATGKLLSPIYLYLIIMIGFLYKQDQKVNTSIFDTMKLLLPVILILLVTGLIIIVGWYVLGLPIGISSGISL